MSSGSLSKVTSSEDLKTIPNSYIVTLRPSLTETQRKEHMQAAFRACNAKSVPGTHDPARITRVHRYPLNSPSPIFYVYLGRFGPDVAEKIRARTDEVESIRLEAFGTLSSYEYEPIPTPSWALSAMSHSYKNFEAQAKAADSATVANQLAKPKYRYNAIKPKGKKVTIFILDSGYEYKSHVDGDMMLRRHLQDRVECHDMNIISTQNALTTTNDPAVNGLPNNEVQTILDALKESQPVPQDRDRTDFHGTNVALCAGSSSWGSAPDAKIVTYDVCNVVKSNAGIDLGPSEGLLIDALLHIKAHPNLENSIVNCSWVLSEPQLKDGTAPAPANDKGTLARKLFDDIVKAGAHVVASAGNVAHALLDRKSFEAQKSAWIKAKSLEVVQKGLKEVPIPFAVTDKFTDVALPSAIEGVILVGALDRKYKRADFSTYPHPDWPPANFFWAPGDKIIGWGKDKYMVYSGTSYAAPLFSGVVASIIAAGGNKPPARDEILTILRQRLSIRDQQTQDYKISWPAPLDPKYDSNDCNIY
ncbi:peptidase S8/S53 domain-containing protein [Xylaria castorea]|nr:peptidase S8/S53 domain-containing protein [Xylaria castorea]